MTAAPPQSSERGFRSVGYAGGDQPPPRYAPLLHARVMQDRGRGIEAEFQGAYILEMADSGLFC